MDTQQLTQQTPHLTSLAQKGFNVKLMPDNTRFTVEPKDKLDTMPRLKELIRQKRDLILAELQATQATQVAQSAQVTQAKPLAIAQICDPRIDVSPEDTCDMPEDSELWTQLLRKAYQIDPDGLFTALYGFRCVGARIKRVVTGYHIIFDESLPENLRGWQSQEDFQKDYTKYLLADWDGGLDKSKTRIHQLLAQLSLSDSSANAVSVDMGKAA